MVNLKVGPPVRGNDLFGRDAFVNVLWRKIQAGNVLLLAPRRFGKTSVMYRLIDQPRDNYKVVHADLEHLSDPADLLLELVVKLAKDDPSGHLLDGALTGFRKFWRGIRSDVSELGMFNLKLGLRDQIRSNWQEIGKEVFRRVDHSPQPILFILDEFPMIDRMARQAETREEAITLLRWLRSVRISPDHTTTRFLIAGSIGIDAVVNDLGEVKSINDFERLRLSPFSPEIADEFLVALATSEQVAVSAECRRRMLDLVGIYVPYFLQILFSEVAKSQQMNGDEITPRMIEHIYRDKVLGVDCKTYFDHYYGRLREYYRPQEEKAVKKLLLALARSGAQKGDFCFELYRSAFSGEADLELFNSMLTNLENDFYIRYNAEDQRYEFACQLLRDWWLRHYGMEVS